MDFGGGDAVCLDPALRFKQRTGAFNRSGPYVLDQMTMPITADQRCGNPWFTKAKVEGDAEMGE